MLATSGTALRVPAFQESQPVVHFAASCVTLAKRLIGFRSWAFTPWQLFCALRHRGCPVIFDSIKEAIDADKTDAKHI